VLRKFKITPVTQNGLNGWCLVKNWSQACAWAAQQEPPWAAIRWSKQKQRWMWKQSTSVDGETDLATFDLPWLASWQGMSESEDKRARKIDTDLPHRPAAGWTSTALFARGGWPAKQGPALRVTVVNPEAGTSALEHERLTLLEVAAGGLEPVPTLYLASAGFFGFRVEPDRTLAWTPIASLGALRSKLEKIVDRWLPHTYLAIGVDDDDGNDQRQWWFRGAHGQVLEIERYRNPKPLQDRIVDLSGYRAIGFVCGEAYQHDEEDLMRALAHAHGEDASRVRNCDNWFVSRGEDPFSGGRTGVRIEVPR
jgi:hypothetical protein